MDKNMNFNDVFANVRVVLPVIHVESQDQALRNVRIAREAGADGVFLINHGMSSDELLRIHGEVAADNSGLWIGVNCLDLDPEDVFSKVNNRVGGVWVDNAAIDEHSEDQCAAEAILKAREKSGWKGLYFGGVAFKYQRPVKDLAQAARRASRYMDVVTTSGPGTGQAADIAKIVAMKEALGDVPLAIASGITPENVADYLDIADCFLVATGISSSFTELDPGRLNALIQTTRSYKPAGRG